MSDRLHVLGIRHHGPGSAASVLRALDQVKPGIVLLEGPPEGDALLPFVAQGLQPPVALLVHEKDDPAQATFYPFAAYSPEWVAAGWALRNGVPVRFIDLPAAMTLHEARVRAEAEAEALAELPDEDEVDELDEPEAEEDDKEEAPSEVTGDPLGYLAALDGYDDGEAWWNHLIEESDGDPEVFGYIEEAMAAMREMMPPSDSPRAQREVRREAMMRQQVRKALKETDEPVVAVVGAWHAPMVRPGVLPIKHDKAVLTGLRKAKVVATWVPWTDSRLARASGYGAGVAYPGWYHSLWRTRHEPAVARQVATQFQTRVAHTLREAGRLAPTSSVIDAVRLTDALSAVRGLARPGLPELMDASIATLCYGDDSAWRLVEAALLVGDRVGRVPESVPQMPLAADLARQQKKLKLKPTGLDQDVRLDLRSQAGGAKSVLLHQLDLLGVAWGKLADSGRSRGTFRENWVLRWEPEHAVALAEALPWGTTVAGAAAAKVAHGMDQTQTPSELADHIRRALLAQLDDAAHHGIQRLQALAATASDLSGLAESVPPLVDILRYGTARELPTTGLSELVEGLVDRTVLALPHGVRDLEAEAAQALQTILVGFDQAIARHADGARLDDWLGALDGVATDEQAAPRLMGFATRRLADGGKWSDEQVATALAASLSPGFPLARAAGWLDGFLGDAALVLLHDPALFALVDGWLVGLSDDDLLEALPLFRRATSGFSSHQRKELLARARGEVTQAAVQSHLASTPAFEAGEALLATILGIGSEA